MKCSEQKLQKWKKIALLGLVFSLAMVFLLGGVRAGTYSYKLYDSAESDKLSQLWFTGLTGSASANLYEFDTDIYQGNTGTSTTTKRAVTNINESYNISGAKFNVSLIRKGSTGVSGAGIICIGDGNFSEAYYLVNNGFCFNPFQTICGFRKDGAWLYENSSCAIPHSVSSIPTPFQEMTIVFNGSDSVSIYNSTGLWLSQKHSSYDVPVTSKTTISFVSKYQSSSWASDFKIRNIMVYTLDEEVESNSAPTITLNYPNNASTNNNKTTTLGFTIYDNDLDLVNVTLYDGDDNLLLTNNSVTNNSFMIYTFADLTANTKYEYNITAIDNNSNIVSEIYEFTTMALPSEPTESYPVNKLVNTTSVTFHWTPSSNVFNYSWKLYDSDLALINNTIVLTNTTNVVDLAEGQYYWEVLGQNSFGFGTSSGNSSFKIDTHAPTISWNFPTESYIFTNSNKLNISINDVNIYATNISIHNLTGYSVAGSGIGECTLYFTMDYSARDNDFDTNLTQDRLIYEHIKIPEGTTWINITIKQTMSPTPDDTSIYCYDSSENLVLISDEVDGEVTLEVPESCFSERDYLKLRAGDNPYCGFGGGGSVIIFSEINFSLSTGDDFNTIPVTYYNNISDLSGSSYVWDTELGLEDGYYMIEVCASDDHTDILLSKESITKETDTKTKSMNLAIEDKNNVSIKLVSDQTITSMKVTEYDDRLSPEITIDSKDLKEKGDDYDENLWEKIVELFKISPDGDNLYEFELKTEEKLVYRAKSNYPAHFVSGNTWIDFQTDDENARYKVEKINDYTYKVYVISKLGTLKFESIGGVNLNCETIGFAYDTTAPEVSISYPENESYVEPITSLNFTATDLNFPSSCWYSLNGGATNVSTSCSENITGISSSEGSNHWIVWSNDSAGNIGSDDIYFSTGIPPELTIHYPENETTYFEVITSLNFSYVEENPNNCWYSVNSGLTNVSTNCDQNITGLTSLEGNNTWTIWMEDDGGSIGSASVFFVSDGLLPVLILNSPANNSINMYNNLAEYNITLSYSATDLSLDSCWYDAEGVNVTFTCNENQTISYDSTGNKTIRYYANETSGNYSEDRTNFRIINYKYYQSGEESNLEGFSADYSLIVEATGNRPVSATLYFNEIAYAPDTINTNSTAYSFEKSITIPAGYGNATGKDVAWFWNYNISEYSFEENTSEDSTIVYSVSIDNCSAYEYVILDYYLYDENLNSLLDLETDNKSSVIEAEVVLRLDGSEWSYNTSVINETNLQICVPEYIFDYADFTLEALAKYSATGYVNEFYYIDGLTITESNTPQTIYLRDLPLTDSTSFKFSLYGVSGLQVPDVVVEVLRRYVGDGVSRIVEREMTDSNGETSLHLIEEDAIYTFKIYDSETLIFTSSDYKALCQSVPCEIQLYISSSVPENPTSYDYGVFSISSSSSERTITLDFELDRSETMNLSVYKYDADSESGVELVDSSSLTASSGSVEIAVPVSSGNVTYYALVTKNNATDTNTFVSAENVDFRGKPFGAFGYSLVVIVLVVLILISVTEGAVPMIVFLFIGIIGVSTLGLISFPIPALVLLGLLFGIVIWKIVKASRGGV